MTDPLDELATVAPGEFVAARTRLVADLKAAGDAEQAARIGKLRKPNQLHWAINVTVREHPDLAAAWAEAADHARDASGAELRPALTAVRDAAAALARAVGRRVPAGDAAQVLAQAAADAELAAAVASGTVGFAVADRPAPRRSSRATKPPEPDQRAVAAERAVADAQKARDAAAREHADAEAQLEAAAAELGEARQRVRAAERGHLAAQRRRAAADRLLAEADDELQRAERLRTRITQSPGG